MRSDWLKGDLMAHVLAALMPQNRLVMQVCLQTGLRVSDVVGLRTSKLARRMTVREMKTGKTRRIYLPFELLRRLELNAGAFYVFEHRTNPKKHRTRQAVYKDVKKAAAIFKRSHIIEHKRQISPHSARKIAAVDVYKQKGLKSAKALLNHSESDMTSTILYILADSL